MCLTTKKHSVLSPISDILREDSGFIYSTVFCLFVNCLFLSQQRKDKSRFIHHNFSCYALIFCLIDERYLVSDNLLLVTLFSTTTLFDLGSWSHLTLDMLGLNNSKIMADHHKINQWAPLRMSSLYAETKTCCDEQYLVKIFYSSNIEISLFWKYFFESSKVHL